MAEINVESQIKQTDKEHVIDQNDPRMRAAVEAFIKTAQQSQPDQVQKPDVPTNQDFAADPLNLQMKDGLAQQDVVVQDFEKTIFLKALLADVPVRLDIPLFNGQLVISLRSRSSYEQERLVAAVNHLVETGRIAKDDLALYAQRFQQFAMAIMVEKINSQQFSEISFKPKTSSLDDDVATLMDFCEKHIFGLNQVRWVALVNAIRIFEGKIARMSTEANNGDFWKPRD